MTSPLEIPAKTLEGWLERWSLVAFSPRAFFAGSTRRSGGAAFQFFVINHLAAYILLFTVSLAFFFVYWRQHLVEHIRKDLVANLTAASALFLAYVVLNFVITLVAALSSWGLARLFRSRTRFPPHLGASLELSAFEPLATPALGMLVLCGLEYGITYAVFGGGAVLLARAWMAWAGYWAMRGLHSLPTWRGWVLYVLGFFVQQVVLTSMCLALVWLFIGMIIVPGWD